MYWIGLFFTYPRKNQKECAYFEYENGNSKITTDSNPTADIAIYIDKLYNSTTNLNNYAQYSLGGFKNFSAFRLALSTYSNSKAGVLSYVFIFENLWKQIELYEDIKKSQEQQLILDKMQQEFINVAAHELRTPIQPILGITQVLRSKISDSQQQDLLDIVIRNAKRLKRLSDEILDVTKLESRNLELKKEEFNLNDIILQAMDDLMLSKEFSSKNLQLLYEPREILLEADKSRIAEVISNLLNNALTFTSEGTITISVKIDKANKNDDNKDWVIVRVKE